MNKEEFAAKVTAKAKRVKALQFELGVKNKKICEVLESSELPCSKGYVSSLLNGKILTKCGSRTLDAIESMLEEYGRGVKKDPSEQSKEKPLVQTFRIDHAEQFGPIPAIALNVICRIGVLNRRAGLVVNGKAVAIVTPKIVGRYMPYCSTKQVTDAFGVLLQKKAIAKAGVAQLGNDAYTIEVS